MLQLAANCAQRRIVYNSLGLIVNNEMELLWRFSLLASVTRVVLRLKRPLRRNSAYRNKRIVTTKRETENLDSTYYNELELYAVYQSTGCSV